MSLLEKSKRFGGGLLQFAHNLGQQTFEPGPDPVAEELAGEPGVQAAKRRYDTDYRVARAEALRRGVPWYEMDSYGHAGANTIYQESLVSAANAASARRKQRDADEKKNRWDDYVTSRTGLSDEQREFLGVADVDTTEEIMRSVLFPDSSGARGATSGVLQGQVVDDAGLVWFPVQTGDPKNPVEMRPALGPDGRQIRTDNTPSEIRALRALQDNPGLLNVVTDKAGAGKYGALEGEANATVKKTVPGSLRQSRTNLAKLKRLREEVRTASTDRLQQYSVVYNARMQALGAELNDVSLRNIAALADAGVRLNPITEAELALLMSTSPSLGNLPEANVAIFDERIRALEGVIREMEGVLRHVDSGASILEYRPGQPAQQPAGGPRPAALGSDLPPLPPGAVLLPGS